MAALLEIGKESLLIVLHAGMANGLEIHAAKKWMCSACRG
jgi:hypothetical protein